MQFSDGYTQNLSICVLEQDAIQALREMAGEQSEAFLVELIDCYLEDSAQFMAAVRLAIAQADAAALTWATHSLKSSSATLGATRFAHLCQELSAIATSGRIKTAAAYLSQLEVEYEQLLAALKLVQYTAMATLRTGEQR